MNASSIGIVTDSTADIPLPLLQQYDIQVVPINIQFGQETYEENVTIDRATFLRWLDDREMPTSSQPSPGRFAQVFQTLVEDGYEQILCVAITSKHSGTFQSAVLASSMMPKVKIEAAVSSDMTDKVIEAISKAANTGKIGDGKIFVSALEQTVRIRTGETGVEAL